MIDSSLKKYLYEIKKILHCDVLRQIKQEFDERKSLTKKGERIIHVNYIESRGSHRGEVRKFNKGIQAGGCARVFKVYFVAITKYFRQNTLKPP